MPDRPPVVSDDGETAVDAEADRPEAVEAEPEPEDKPCLPEALAQTQAAKTIADETEPVERPAEPPPMEGQPPPEAREPATKWCHKCGEVQEWFTFGDFVACGECFQPLDTGG